LLQVKEGKTVNKSFTTELYPTDNHFGPISHYKVFAVPVQKEEGQPEDVPYTPTVPLEQLPSHAISSHLVSEVSDPIPFVIGQYGADSLPKRLTFDGHWMRRAFKPETHYSIAVAAFTKTANTSESLYSFSELADPPVYIGEVPCHMHRDAVPLGTFVLPQGLTCARSGYVLTNLLPRSSP